MERQRAILQLRLISAMLRQERDAQRPTIAVAVRASGLIEQTAIAIGPEPDDELLALLTSARQDVVDLAETAVE